jgi:anti-anti-sigma factor
MDIPGPRTSPTSPMRLHVSRLPAEIAVIGVAGEVDLSNTADLEAALARHLRAGPLRLVVDLSEVRFLSVGGMRVLLRTRRLAEECGVEFAVEPGDSRSVNRMLAITPLPAARVGS